MIKSIKLNNFKSHPSLGVDFDNITAIVGKNATGKTNILEAIYYSLITKPFKSNRASLINYDSDFTKINLIYESEKENDIESRLKSNGRSLSSIITINGVKKRASEVIGLQPIVVFVPDDSRLITDGPQFRRNLINSIIIQTSKDYLNALNKFQKILNQRNRLLYSLRNNLTSSKDQLFVYNLQLAEPISTIYKYRDEFISFLNNNLSEKYSSISGSKDKVHVDYLNTLAKDKDDILKMLESNTVDDIRLGYTSKGPHKDEILISLNNFPSRDNLSRGENRSLSLAIKLAEIEYLKIKTSTPPLLLLDDVLSELDSDRQKHLIEQAEKQQTIITSTEIDKSISCYKLINL
jgi:DNA replication and repair protein RecF